jgi:hypothetical protein
LATTPTRGCRCSSPKRWLWRRTTRARGVVSSAGGWALRGGCRRALARLDAREHGQGLAAGLPAGPADEAVAAARISVTDVFDAARGGNWDDAVTSLRDSPPHEGAAGPSTLHAAALLAEGRGKSVDAAALEAAALAAAGGDPDAVSVSTLARIAEGDGKPELRVAGAGAGRRALHARTRRRSRWRSSIRCGRGWQRRRAIGASASEHWRAALAWIRAACPRRGRCAATPPGAATWRCRSTRPRRGGLPARPEHRVHTLLLAAALAEEAARGEEGGVPHRRRAMALLRAVLEIDPGHEGAFEQLRTLAGRIRRTRPRWRRRWRRVSRWRRIRSR